MFPFELVTEVAMAIMVLLVNGSEHRVDVAFGLPLLYVLREHLQMTGTKYGCG